MTVLMEADSTIEAFAVASNRHCHSPGTHWAVLVAAPGWLLFLESVMLVEDMSMVSVEGSEVIAFVTVYHYAVEFQRVRKRSWEVCQSIAELIVLCI